MHGHTSATQAEAIMAYVRAKDENRPYLMEHAFDPQATLAMVVKSDAISFPPVAHGRDAITRILVRDFARTYENVRTVCLSSPPRAFETIFSCSWLVGMSAKDGGAVRVGCGLYHWSFRPRSPGLAIRLEIVIELMQLLPAETLPAVTSWLFALPYPWCPVQAAFANAPRLDELDPLRQWSRENG
jgi:hypothetical protein